MTKYLSARRLTFVGTLKCTLNCKLCCNYMPKFEHPEHIAAEELIRDIDYAMEVFDYVEWLQFVGGEIFMNKEMAQVYEYCLDKKAKFGKLIIMTNACLVPRADEIAVLKKYGEDCKILISDYGELSYKIDEFVRVMQANSIPYVIKPYHGDVQYYGGWFDNTQIEYLNENDDTIAALFPHCHQYELLNMHCCRGKLHPCSVSCFLSELGAIVPAENNFIDLNDKTRSVEEKRNIVSNFYKQPVYACRFCKFKNAATAERFPAGEQIKTT